MAEQNPQVMELVRQELERDPGASTQALYERAREVDPSIGELSTRQFHARYPLQVKRAQGGGGGRKRGGGGKGGGARKGRKAAAPAAAQAPERGEAPRARAGGRRGGASAAGEGVDREAVRRVLLDFATDFAEAESRSEIVRVLNGVDAYVERITRIAGGARS